MLRGMPHGILQGRLGNITDVSAFQVEAKSVGEFENKFLPLIFIPGFLLRRLQNECG